MNDKEILKIVIMQMLEHNKNHRERYEKWAGVATTKQLIDVGTLLSEAKYFVESENGILRKVLDHLTSIDNVNS